MNVSSSIHRFWFAPLIALGLGWPLPMSADGSGELQLQDNPPEVERNTAALALEAGLLWQHPGSYLGETVVLTVQYKSKPASWNPLVTRFGDGEYSAWDAWADEQFPWREADFFAPRVRVFARHDSAAEWALADVETYSRYELTCVARSSFANRPWLEVVAVKPLVRRLGEGSIVHASRGLEFMKKGAWKGAISEFDRAGAGGVPRKAQEELERLSEICRSKLPLRSYRPNRD